MKKLLILLLLGTCLIKPGYSEIENLDYNTRKITSTGKGESLGEALEDSKFKALELALTDLIQTNEEKNKYLQIETEIKTNIDNYISREKIISKMSTENSKEITIKYSVNIGELKSFLIKRNVLKSVGDIVIDLENPKIMVIYDIYSEKDNQYSLWSVSRANNYLLEKGFLTVDQKSINELKKDESFLKKLSVTNQKFSEKPDNSKIETMIAAENNADYILKISLKLTESGRSGEYTFVSTPVSVSAFKSISGDSFINKTYSRLDKDANPESLAIKGSIDISKKAVIEEAVAGVMPLIEKDLLNEWKNDLKKGKEYIISFKDSPSVSKMEFIEYLKSLSKEFKQKENNFLIRFEGSADDLTEMIEEHFQDKVFLEYQNYSRILFKAE